MKKISIFLLCSFVASVYADVVLESEKITIKNVSQPELYVFCNQKDVAVVLDRVDFDDPGVQAGWWSALPPHMCSIFFTDKSPFTFSCRQEALGGFNLMNCQNVLLASRLPWSGQTLNHQAMTGSYWIVENATPDELIIMLRHRNIDT